MRLSIYHSFNNQTFTRLRLESENERCLLVPKMYHRQDHHQAAPLVNVGPRSNRTNPLVSLQDRYFIACRNAHHPLVITYITTYPSPSLLPSKEELQSRVEELQRRFPLLRSTVRNSRSTSPYFEENENIWPGGRMLRERTYGSQVDMDESREREREELFKMEWEDLEGDQDYDTRPEWGVTIYRPRSSARSHGTIEAGEGEGEGEGEEGRAYIALTVEHVITDGRGGMRLNDLLLNPSSTDSNEGEKEDLPSIPAMDDHIAISPSIPTILRMILLIFLLPKLPLFLKRLIQPYDAWLGGLNGHGRVMKRSTSKGCERGVKVTLLSKGVMDKVKEVGKREGVETIHSILYVAYLTAIWSVYVYPKIDKDGEGDTPDPDQSQSKSKPKPETTLFTAQMPTSERNSHPSFSYCTANYVGALMIDILISPSASFFRTSLEMYETYTSSSGISQSRQNMGFTSYLPNKSNPLSPSDPGYKEDRPTSWEDTFLDIFEGEEPYRYSTSFSNLGRIAKLPRGAEGVCWSLNSQAFQPPLTIDLVGHEGECEVVTTWMEGVGVEKEGVERVGSEFERIMRRLADWEGGRELTFGELVTE